MPCHYVVIQYICDPIADERVNLGVLAYDEHGEWQLRMLDDWKRAERFTGITRGGLRRHGDDITEALTAASAPAQLIEKWLTQWEHSLQLSHPRGSLRSVEETVRTITEQVLVEQAAKRQSSGRPALVRKARSSIEASLSRAQLSGLTEQVLSGKQPVAGHAEPHEVDLALRNGHLLMAARALAFSARRSTYMEYEVSDTAWTVRDLQELDDGPEFAVLLSPPQDKDRPDYQRALSLFGELNAEVVFPPGLERWADRTVERYRPRLDELAIN